MYFNGLAGFAYDQRGNKIDYTSPEGISHTYSYLKNNRLDLISFDGQAIDLVQDKTRLKQIIYPNGVTTDYGYNVGGWLSSIATKQGVTSLLQRDYQFDPVGNIDQMTSQAGDTLYSYDDTYQLTGADHPQTSGLADEAYSFDKVGNRLTSSATPGSWSHNQNNELLDTSAARYEYDANGNMVKKTSGGLTTRYEYNARNRLSRVILPNGQVASYSYDPFGRRVKKQVDSEVTWYVYADEGLVGEYSASGGMQKAYGWKPGGLWGTDPLYMLDGSGTYFYHNDHLGTPQRMSDATTGAVVWSAGYAAFGLATVDPLSTAESNLRFPGQYFDVETGLRYNWMRTYDPGTGRYTQVDPLAIGGNVYNGGVNVSFSQYVGAVTAPYRYTENNPLSWIDPFGLWCIGKAATAALAGAVVGASAAYLNSKLGDSEASGAVGAIAGSIAGGKAGLVGGGIAGTGAASTGSNAFGGAVGGAVGGALKKSKQIGSSLKGSLGLNMLKGGLAGLVGGAVEDGAYKALMSMQDCDEKTCK